MKPAKLILLPLLIFYTPFLFGQRIYDNGPIIEQSSNARFAPEPLGRSWDCSSLTYFFVNSTNDISVNAQRNAVRSAMEIWEARTYVTFVEVNNANDADIRISWALNNHGDPCNGCAFDGNGNTLAHAFYPPPTLNQFAGDIHFDDAELWTNNIRSANSTQIDLVTVAAHELGHSLGLAHSTDANALMNATYNGSHRYLTPDDISGIQSIYGVPAIISGSYSICTSNKTFTIQNKPSGSTVSSWSVTPINLFAVDTGAGNSFTTRATNSSSSGVGIISATIVETDGCESTISKTVQIGKFGSQVNITGTNAVCATQSYHYRAEVPGGHQAGYTYQWTLPNSWVIHTQSQNGIYASPYGNNFAGQMLVTVNNGCGNGGPGGKIVYPNFSCSGFFSFKAYPNPTNGATLTIESSLKTKTKLVDSNSAVIAQTTTIGIKEFEYILYDMSGIKLEQSRSRNNKAEINTKALKNGMYHLKIIQGSQVENQTIIVK